MSSKINIYQNLDDKTANFFGSITQNKLSKITAFIENNFSEKAQQLVHLSISFCISITPLLVCLIFYISNKNTNQETIKLQELTASISKLETQEEAIKKSLKSLMSAKDLSSSSSFSKFIYSKLRSSGISLSNIKISNVENIETIGDVQIVQIEGKVDGTGTKEVSRLLNIISASMPRSINEITLASGKNDKLLNVNFSYEAKVRK